MNDSWGTFGTDKSTGSYEPEKTEEAKTKRTRTEREPKEKAPRQREPRERAPRQRTARDRGSVGDLLRRISPENWVDIICCTLIAAFVIAVACNWTVFSEWLFRSILFPIINIGAKIVSFVAGVGIVVGAIVLWFRSRTRRRWW